MPTYCLSSDKNRQFVRQACTRTPTKKEKGDAHQEKNAIRKHLYRSYPLQYGQRPNEQCHYAMSPRI